MKTLSISDIQFIAFRLAKDLLEYDEPIPPFQTRFPNVLESCVATPFQRFQKKLLYKGLVGRATILFYLMIKNHPFQNGNKRIAITALLVFLSKNKKWLRVDGKEFYNFTVWVAQSPADEKNYVVLAIEQFLKNHLINFNV
ncbi:hypothetical protein COW09_01905 [bacterium (Candidatus Moisslbacteria) CG12_big_fil_rev_8_21_14_0_65_36_11]|nr:type II toxin-antitoxin system death-on-curing family toxin [Candidatus Kuenenbacteria bacterium]OIP76411.1 MAG: hypothetical protein AUK09_02015 [Parcubacteria group bacterium CG2_30_36_38]PIW67706.1 MAG: hypothetical protein COW09_01905 [bacterium (Candidatus Moisslbacteria) CG12_big_fil_rev_8_21_14_0_65_36_11]